jgi:GAF domain-containing protein
MSSLERREHEGERVRALRASGWLDHVADPRLDDIVGRAATLFGVPIAAVGLVDDAHLHFRASLGVGVPYTSREHSFCARVMTDPRLLVVCDAREDSRFQGMPLVTGEAGIRFYAGVPVYGGNGLLFGALCVLDTAPHPPLDAAQQEALSTLAAECSTVLAGPPPRRS